MLVEGKEGRSAVVWPASGVHPFQLGHALLGLHQGKKACISDGREPAAEGGCQEAEVEV